MDTANTAPATDDRSCETPIGIARSRAAFLRDLPKLLANPKYDRWCAAYCGEERIAFAKSLAEVTQICRERGLRENDFYIGCIVPHSDEEEEGSEEESEEEETAKPIIPNENPNLVKKGPVKASAVKGPPQELTRRERYKHLSNEAYF